MSTERFPFVCKDFKACGGLETISGVLQAQYLAVEKDTAVVILQVQDISAFVKCNIHAFDPFDCDSPALFRRRQGAESGWG